MNVNVCFSLFFKYDDFFDGDDDELLYLTQVVEMETKIAESNNPVKSTQFQTSQMTHQNNIKKEQIPTISVTKNNKVETIKRAVTTAGPTKMSDIVGPSTSVASSSSLISTARYPNDKDVIVNSTDITQTSGKRIASSPLHMDTKRPSIELYKSEDIWDVINMERSNPLIKILKCTSVYKNSKIQIKQNEWVCSGTVIDKNTLVEVEFSSEVRRTI